MNDEDWTDGLIDSIVACKAIYKHNADSMSDFDSGYNYAVDLCVGALKELVKKGKVQK